MATLPELYDSLYNQRYTCTHDWQAISRCQHLGLPYGPTPYVTVQCRMCGKTKELDLQKKGGLAMMFGLRRIDRELIELLRSLIEAQAADIRYLKDAAAATVARLRIQRELEAWMEEVETS